MNQPPVAFFGFNRPDCTARVFAEIRRFKPATLLLVADGPRSAVTTDAARCAAVREIITQVDWPCEVRQNFSETNLGCKKRMASGMDWVFSEVESAILLEDDCLPCPDFFNFCCDLLARYQNEPRVGMISGDNFQDGHRRGLASYYFSRYSHIWGWASWRRAWNSYDVTLKSWPAARANGWLASLGLDGIEQKYWTTIFDQVHSGQINTWDYQWLYACWQNQRINILPNVNLITNIGASPDATHTKGAEGSLAIATGTLGTLTHPQKIQRDTAADQYTFDVHYGGRARNDKPSLATSTRRYLGKIKRKLLQ